MAIGTPVDIGHNQVSSGTTLAITTTANILTGDFVLIVAMGGTASTQITSVTTDASGNVYTVPTAGSQTDSASFAFTPNAVALNSGATLTVNFGGAAGRHGIQAYRITGLVTSAAAVLDGAKAGHALSRKRIHVRSSLPGGGQRARTESVQDLSYRA